MPRLTAHQIFSREALRSQLTLAVKRCVRAASGIAMLYYQGDKLIAPLPEERDRPNPRTNADDEITCTIFETLHPELERIIQQYGCRLTYFAEESHNERGQRRTSMREGLSHGSFMPFPKAPRDFYTVDENTVQVLADGLDADKNLMASIPNFCISICILTQNRPRLVVVENPVTQAVYEAYLAGPPDDLERDTDARMNGISLKPRADQFRNQHKSLKDVFIAAHLTHNNLAIYDMFRPYFDMFHHRSQGMQLSYCGILGLMGTGLGQYGCYINPYVSAWDALPGEIFIRALGGKVTDLAGRRIHYATSEKVSIVASLDRNIHQEVLDILKPFTAAIMASAS